MSFKCSLQKIHKDLKNDYFVGKDLQKPSFYFKEQSPKIKFNIRNFLGASNMGMWPIFVLLSKIIPPYYTVLYTLTHRRRMETEAKAKVVLSV